MENSAIKCRLCGTEEGLILPTSEELNVQILTLFQVEIGGQNDRLTCCVCSPCTDTVHNTWLFLEQVQQVQQKLLEELNNETQTLICPRETTESVVENLLEPLQIEMQEATKSVCKKDSTKSASNKIQKKKCASDDLELSETVIQRHMQGWDSYPWACCDCGQSVLNQEELKDHYMRLHGQTSRFACADCPKVYTKYSMFLVHVRVHRPYFKCNCDVCYKWFSTAKQQEKHRQEHGDERPHACVTCGKRFRMQSALLVHSRSHLPAELKNRYQCDQCPKRFGTKPNLMAHKRIHAGVRDYACDQCGKSFVQKGNLDNHMLTHESARPFNCATCGKSFKTLVRLTKHSTVHSGLKPHTCEVCGRQFRERGTLKEHLRIHTGAMPFTCEFCGKSFRFKGVLTTHRRQHTGERPYSCVECQHHFTNWPNYNKHMKRRHGINTSVTVRKPQTIPPTGMPQRNPPGSVLAPPQLPESHFITDSSSTTQFYPVLNLYNIPEDLLQHRTVQ